MVSTRLRALAGLALALTVLLAGCTGAGPRIVERECGNVVGVGGCVVTVENPSDEAAEVTVTVEALTADDEVVATGTETVVLAGGERREVTVGASNAGGEVERYEATVEQA